MKPRLPHLSVAIAACLYAAAAASEIQLLPAGQFAARDGRPGKGLRWQLTDADGRQLAARLNARSTPLVIDYEHQTLHAEDNGQPAPAAGWASEFAWRDGKGLFAVNVQWTDRARQMIEAGEYRFLSPVFTSEKVSGRVLDVLHAALVNFPGLDGMEEVADRIAMRMSAHPEEPSMNPLLKKLLAAIGLQDDATEETALTAVAALQARADERDALGARLEAATAEVAALKAARPADTEAINAMRALQTELAQLRGKLAARDLDEVINAALAAGKLVPAQESWARELGAKDLAALQAYIETAPGVAALAGQQSGGRGAARAGAGNAGAIAQAALKYQREQAAVGVTVSTAQAVAHVAQQAA